MSPSPLRWAEVDLRAVAHNVALLESTLAPGCALMAVIKANGYGHGAVEVGRTALAAGAGWLAVSTLAEALALREAGITAPVMMLGPVPEGGEAAVIEAGLRVPVYDPEGVARLAAATTRGAAELRVHLKVDTGMARLGCPPEEALILARRVRASPGLVLEGLWTHFAEADSPDPARTARQLARFMDVVGDLATAGIQPPVLYCANSAAALLYPSTHLTLVRCGLPVYGYPSAATIDLELRPALAWKSRVVAVRNLAPGDRVGYGGTYAAEVPTRVATVATGYADGYPRGLSGRGTALLGGQRCDVVGRVSMDFMTIDASAVDGVEPGDEVVIIGRQGEESISAVEVAESIASIPWEVLAMIGARVERVFLDG
ncbi:MAG: alanine racemase [Candidatus Dormibacteria bacterium]